jgi:hypothetical protein
MPISITIGGRLNKYKSIEDRGYNTPCWIWVGGRFKSGYGAIKYNGKTQKVHRVSANFYLNFDLGSNLKVLHKCDVNPCFNPDHLFIGTLQDNSDDMIDKSRNFNQNKTHCPKGHKYEGNTYLSKNGSGYVGRKCRQCTLERLGYK